MTQLTRLMRSLDAGDQAAAEELLPLVYEELRKLAEARLASEPAAVMSSATSLVHDVYLRLLGPEDKASFANRRHFFSSAAEAMRRILIDRARQRQTAKHGGGRKQFDLDACNLSDPLMEGRDDEIVALDEAMADLAEHDMQSAELVKLRFFGGLTHQEAAQVLGITRRQADGLWTVARTWLFQRLSDGDSFQTPKK